MLSFWDEFWTGAVYGIPAAIIGGLIVLLWGLFQTKKFCPDCGTALPRILGPKQRQFRRSIWWGSWICPKCGCEINRKGKKVEKQATWKANPN